MPMNGERIEKLSLTSEPLGFMLAMKSSQSGDFQRMAERFASKAPWELLDFSPLAHTFNISLVEVSDGAGWLGTNEGPQANARLSFQTDKKQTANAAVKFIDFAV